MKTDENWLLPFLARVRPRPGMYLGDEKLETLHAYVLGRRHGRESAGLVGMTEAEQLLLTSFAQWLTTQFPEVGDGEWAVLVGRLGSDRPARKFLELFERFLLSNSKSLLSVPPEDDWDGGVSSAGSFDWLLPLLSLLSIERPSRFLDDSVLTINSFLRGYELARDRAGLKSMSASDAELLRGFKEWLLDLSGSPTLVMPWYYLIKEIDGQEHSGEAFFRRLDTYLIQSGRGSLANIQPLSSLGARLEK